MFNGGMSPSLADIAAVTGNNGNNGGFGDGNGWWVLIILFALFGGWGNRNNDGNSGGSAGYMPAAYFTDSALQRGFDNQTVMNKLNGLENGLCSLGYDQLAQMNNITSSINTNGYETRNAIQQLGFNFQTIANQNQIADMQRDFALQQQFAQCCCDQRADAAQARYDNATNTCTITTAIANAARDIIENNNCNYRSLYDQQVAAQIQAKDDKISSLQRALDRCDDRAIANEAVQSAVNQIHPPAGPAWIVPNPYANYNNFNYNPNACGCSGTNFNFV